MTKTTRREFRYRGKTYAVLFDECGVTRIKERVQKNAGRRNEWRLVTRLTEGLLNAAEKVIER